MSLSGGQKQRVAIASALASSKKVLIFDEPTSGLDYSHMLEAARLFQAIAEDGMAVLVVTHDMDLVAECCDFAVVLERGAVLREGPVDASFLVWAIQYLRRDTSNGNEREGFGRLAEHLDRGHSVDVLRRRGADALKGVEILLHGA